MDIPGLTGSLGLKGYGLRAGATFCQAPKGAEIGTNHPAPGAVGWSGTRLQAGEGDGTMNVLTVSILLILPTSIFLIASILLWPHVPPRPPAPALMGRGAGGREEKHSRSSRQHLQNLSPLPCELHRTRRRWFLRLAEGGEQAGGCAGATANEGGVR